MATQDISVTPYNGALLSGQLLSSSRTIVLGAFGPTTTGTLTDDDGTLSDADDGVALFDGQPINYIGSGTAQAGISVLGATVGIGPEVDIVVFEAGGQIFFHYPAGRPSAVAKIAEVIDIDPVPYDVFTPICFCDGTLIGTTLGDLPVEEVFPGMEVVDIDGRAHEVLWTGVRRLTIPTSEPFRKWLPVRIARNALGGGVPYVDTFVSQQHRILLSTRECQIIFGEACFAPAKSLVNDTTIRIDHSFAQINYHHILCAEHVVLVANGMAAESLFLGDVSVSTLNDRDYAEVLDLFPTLEMKMSHPVLHAYEARAVAEARPLRQPRQLPAAISRSAPPAFRPEPRC